MKLNAADLKGLPEDAIGLQLCKIVGDDDLRMSEPVIFAKGYTALHTALRRAAISGKVGPVKGEIDNYFADLLDESHDMVATIPLDRGSWNVLKNKLAKCRMLDARGE